MDAPFPEGLLESWEKVLKYDRVTESGLDIYGKVFDDGIIFPLQRKRELTHMMRVARFVKPQTIMEIGTDKGAGLYHWIKCQPSVTRAIACEIRGCPYKELFQDAFPHVEFLWLEESSLSLKALDAVEYFLGNSFIDCLFIDGDKSHFFTDFTMYSRLTSNKSIIFMHDIQDRIPGAAFDDVRRLGNYDCDTYIDKSELLEEIPNNSYGNWLKHWHGASCGVGIIKKKPKSRHISLKPGSF